LGRKFEIEGIITALVTPLTEKEEIKEDGLRQLIDFQIEHGVNGFFPLGTTGEGMKLSLEKRKKVAEIVVDHTDGRVPIILHVGTQDTEMTIELAKHGRDIGVDAIGAVGPFFYTPDSEGLIQHYKRISDAVDLPLFVYNNAGKQGYNISPRTFGRIAEAASNVCGVKDTSYRVDQIQEYVYRFGRDYTIISAGDSLIFANLAVGAVGHICAVSNAFPEIPVQIYNAVKAKDYDRARELQFKLNEIRDALKKGPYLTPYKEALRLRGIDVGTVSSPLRAMNEKEKRTLKEDLERLGVI